jgi:hypothetical protein
MNTTLWDLPVASTGFTHGPELEMRPKRAIAIRFAFDGVAHDDGREKTLALVFDGTEALKVTHYNARPEWMLVAYDRLVDLGETTWLLETRDELQRRGTSAHDVRHLMINFDDGPCFEILCRDHAVEGPMASS